jgi:hypothetical protein
VVAEGVGVANHPPFRKKSLKLTVKIHLPEKKLLKQICNIFGEITHFKILIFQSWSSKLQ